MLSLIKRESGCVDVLLLELPFLSMMPPSIRNVRASRASGSSSRIELVGELDVSSDIVDS